MTGRTLSLPADGTHVNFSIVMTMKSAVLHNIFPPQIDGDAEIVVLSLSAGTRRSGNNQSNNILYFVSEGELEFSYNEYIGRRFKKGALFFVPRSSETYCRSVSDARLIAVSLNHIEWFCDAHKFSQYVQHAKYIVYDFDSLKATRDMSLFMKQLLQYVERNMLDGTLCELKQRELFILIRHDYVKDDIVRLFYPVLGKDLGFKSKIMEVSYENLSTRELAERFNMSQRNFSRKFRDEFGESAYQWMLKQKAQRIKLRMMVPGATVNDVINHFGFTSPSYFWEFCRKQYGKTPQELLKDLQN